MALIGSMRIEIDQAEKRRKLSVQAGMYRLVTDLTFDDLEQLARFIDAVLLEWRRERNRIVSDHYAVLGVSRDATADAIHSAYRTLAKRHHPDTSASDSHAAMQAVNDAYATLSDDNARRMYDAHSVNP